MKNAFHIVVYSMMLAVLHITIFRSRCDVCFEWDEKKINNGPIKLIACKNIKLFCQKVSKTRFSTYG